MAKESSSIRVRIAPSPTGKFHFGLARTALFNYLFARQHQGTFILRIEDTDAERNQAGSLEDITESLRWLGLQWDEGVEVGGPYGPYFQTQQRPVYQKFIDRLIADGQAYKCFCTPAELEQERQAQQAKKAAPMYSGKCRQLTMAAVAEREKAQAPFAVRFRTPERTVVFNDLVKGRVSFDAQLFGDFVIQRASGMPLYVFAVVIDDYTMKISDVLRGEEHLPNAAKHILIAEALKFAPPRFGHFPLIINADRSKMSKRKNPVSITEDYRAKGYLPEALINFMALLGWAPGDDREFFTLPELVKAFSIERVGVSPAIFDPEKLLWLNGYYIRQLPLAELASRAAPFLTSGKIKTAAQTQPQFYLQALSLVQDRLKTLTEVESLIGFFFALPDYPAELLIAKKSDLTRTKKALLAAAVALKTLTDFTTTELETALRAAAESAELTAGELLWSVRVALTASNASPGAFEVLEVLGQAESLKRLANAERKLAS